MLSEFFDTTHVILFPRENNFPPCSPIQTDWIYESKRNFSLVSCRVQQSVVKMETEMSSRNLFPHERKECRPCNVRARKKSLRIRELCTMKYTTDDGSANMMKVVVTLNVTITMIFHFALKTVSCYQCCMYCSLSTSKNTTISQFTIKFSYILQKNFLIIF